ncbi:MAG: sigma-70 family RNA polymerase sigma factor [Bdellovibrionota bacterium]
MVDEVGPRLYRYFKYKGCGDEAADLTQETFIRLVRVRDKFDSSRGPVVAFALGIALNVWRESRRQNHREHEPIEAANEIVIDSGLQERLERMNEASRLREVVTHLPLVQQDVLYFYFDEEMTTRAIGEALDMPEGTVKSHLHRAKETLRTLLEKKEWI